MKGQLVFITDKELDSGDWDKDGCILAKDGKRYKIVEGTNDGVYICEIMEG